MIRKTAIARSIALAFGLATAGLTLAPTAFAQSNTTGTIYGTVPAAAGAEVVVESKETGFKRTIKPDASGRFNLTSIPAGTYSVSLVRNGQVVSKQEGIEVRISQGSEVTLSGTQTVQIRASRIAKIDTSSATSAAVFTAKDLERLPVAGNVGAIIQLAPNTTRGDARYGGAGAPAFGGSSASENAFYINGFPVTTLLTQVGFSQLPFNSIGQAQVLTGGYGAEFGRSTGGVVNIITKRGSNEWEVGGQISFEPRRTRAKEKNMYYEPNGTLNGNNVAGSTWNGVLRVYNADNEQDRTIIGAYAGGPLIKDKLFFFGSFEQTRTNRDSVRLANASATYNNTAATNAAAWEERQITIPRYLLKFDWAITDNHTLEYTRVYDKVKDDRKYSGFNYATLTRNGVQSGGANYVNWGPTPVAAAQGATVDIVKYTGYLTDNLTVTALVGRTSTPHSLKPVGYNPAFPQVAITAPAPGITYVNNQTIAGNLLVEGAFDKNSGKRFDVEYKLGSSHKLRAGLDYNTIKSYSGQATAGGSLYTYAQTNPAVPLDTKTAATNTVAGNALAQLGYYVARNVTSTGSRPTVDQQAQYIEDQWQVTKDLLLILGLRNEGFNNKNGDGQSYIKLSKQLAPRLAATWDLKGDASSVLKGTFGRYHVPVPTNVAIRGAGSSLVAQQNFVYTGVDPATGAPTGTTAISPLYSNNNELGQARDPREVAAKDIKGNYQDELTLGIQQAVARGWVAGAKFTYRSLKTAIDDHCDPRPFVAWGNRNGVANADNFESLYHCALFNPGLDNRFTQDLNGDGTLENIYLTAAELGFPKVKRTYTALDLELEHPFDGKWWGKVTYTLSRNAGNTEGQLLSDIGQGDVSTTQAFDFPEFSVNSNGLLPNDRKHQLKLFGFYQATPEWGFGGNMTFASGRPRNCIGNAPTSAANSDPFVQGGVVNNYAGYGSAYFFCRGVAAPRGSLGRLSAEFNVDLGLKYSPQWMPGLSLKADFFNVFDRQVGEVIEERFNAAGGSSLVRNTYGAIVGYSAPRSAKFTIAYDKKF